MRRIAKILGWALIGLAAAATAGCIKNDIPYPRLQGNIIAFEVEGQTAVAVIDSAALTVTVDIVDTVDPAKLRLLKFTLSDRAVAEPAQDSGDILDMRSPLKYTITTWPDQSYEWTVTAVQTIERYIRAKNQIGEAKINPGEYEAVLYIAEDNPLEQVEITGIQLGPSNSVITPDPTTVHDFTAPQKFTVTYRDVTEEWTVTVMPTEVTVTTSEADAWAHFAYLYGMVPSGSEAPGFRYMKAGGSEWTDVPAADVTVDGMNVSALLRGLDPGADYVYKIYSGSLEGGEVSFTTETAEQMPNMGFDEWNKPDKNWYANADQADPWWDSGNEGANMLGEANPTSPEETKVKKGKAARLETVSVVGVMAGGNIYSGDFGRTIMEGGMGAEVYFGRPFAHRPLRLTGYYSYEPAVINKAKAPYDNLMGEMDMCHIFVYVMASDGPKTVNTVKGIYLNVNDPDVIGYGELVDNVGTGGQYKEFSIDIKYRDHRKPTYCAVVAVASKYADYFTGGIGSLMYVDEFAFEYDGDVVWEEGAQQ